MPEYRKKEVLTVIQDGRQFIKSIQRIDGSWYGSWGNCFIYGTWFGVEALKVAGESVRSPAMQKAVCWILSKQNKNGGWGESYLSCVNKAYSPSTSVYGDGGSGVVQTAWAMLTLLAAECEDRTAIEKGKQFLMRMQLPSGDWTQEGIT